MLLQEFENLRLPGYELHKLDDFYYYTLSRNTSSQGRSRACSNRSASFDVAGSQVWLADSSFNDSMSLNHSRSNSDAVPVQVPGSGLAVEGTVDSVELCDRHRLCMHVSCVSVDIGCFFFLFCLNLT